ncbi:MAG: Transcriptional regulator [Verrucomicrobiales bacterium]|nr:Transcriptional regulator [Verrucomicrobiales bacterium]
MFTKKQYETLAAFRYRLRLFLQFSEEAAKKEGLSGQQHQALLAIKGFPGREVITVGELAERLCIHHNSAVGLVNRLEKDGLVTKKSGEIDRREMHVSLTLGGTKMLESLAYAHKEELLKIGPQLRSLLSQISE